MTELSPPRIVCAAVRLPDGRCVAGPRHFDGTMWSQILGISLEAFKSIQSGADHPLPIGIQEWQRAEEGFIDQHGRFYSRENAWPIALGNRQIDPGEMHWQTGCLHSEHLY